MKLALNTAVLLLLIGLFAAFDMNANGPELLFKKKNGKHYNMEFYVLKEKKKIKQGEFKAFYKAGGLAEKGQYNNNKRSGVWEYHLRDGKLIEKYDYSTNKSIFLEPHYDDNGKFYIDRKLFQMELVDEMPVFQGGYFQMMRHIETGIRYPEMAHEDGVQGTVIISLTVLPDGAVSNVRLAKPVNVMLDDEAIRVVRSMPDWHPGKKDGKPVAVKYLVPVHFQLM